MLASSPRRGPARSVSAFTGVHAASAEPIEANAIAAMIETHFIGIARDSLYLTQYPPPPWLFSQAGAAAASPRRK
jgi:hypothetical protein